MQLYHLSKVQRDTVEVHDTRKIANSISTIAILTANCLETKEMIFALQAASFHYKELSRVILVHAAESCYFPVPPESVIKCFSEKAITWLSCYATEGVEQIKQKFIEEKKSWENSLKQQTVEVHQENLRTRVFLRYSSIELHPHSLTLIKSQTKYRTRNCWTTL